MEIGGVKKNMKNFRRSLKGISPIFATLILIAIAVIAGVVVYAFTSGMLSGMTATSSAGQEKIAVQSSGINAAKTVVTIYAQQTGGPAAKINSLIIKDSTGNTVGTVTASTPGTLDANGKMVQGTLYTINGAALTSALTSGSYTATLVTSSGGNFVSPAFTV
jgi:archaeal type IV pilus assembly protein PilA